MKLTQIDILKYKSIKSPVSILFREGKVVTLIGKNGSGKTNVLEAIKLAMSINRNYRTEKIESKIKYHLELTDEETNDYFACVQAERRNKEIVVEFNGNNPEIRLIEAPIIEIDAEIFKLRLEDVLKKYKDATHKYLKALKEIESSDSYSYFGNYLNVNVINESGSIVNLMSSSLDQIERNITNQVKEIKDYIQQIFKDNKISLNQYEHSYPFSRHFWSIPFYRIPEDEKIQISPIVAQSLNINKKALNKANEKLNNKLKEINNLLDTEYKEIKAQIDEFDKIKQEIANIFDAKSEESYKKEEQTINQFESIIQKLRNAVFKNCYYIDNENSLIFYNSTNRAYRNEQINQEYLNSKNPIFGTFDIFLHNRGIIDEQLSVAQSNKLEDSQVRKALKALNSEFLTKLMPKFENSEIKKFEVKYDNGSFNLYVHEKNGDIVPFDSTSLGRRWYLTYQFVKNLLNPGDLLLVDEPAAFLHPQAQAEFKKELEMLAQQGIYVFYSTHSPYLIPEDWGQVYNIVMTESGTQIVKCKSGDELCEVIKNEIGANNVANILFNLEKTILLVEGVADMTCLEKFAEVLSYDLEPYKILPCNGSPIFDVAYLCIKQGIKFKALFDLDNKNKPESWMDKKYGYKEYIKIFDTNEDCIFTPSLRQKKSLEDCFHEQDNARYFFDYKYSDKNGTEHIVRKIDKDKIKQATEFEEETKYNFEQLFNQLGIHKLDESKS